MAQVHQSIVSTPPLFYRQLVALCGDAHRQFGLAHASPFSFAASGAAIPLGVGEFGLALRHYPIVFTTGEHALPLAVTGLVDGRNLFVDRNGNWRQGCFVPGYVRRYPFILDPAAGQDSATLMIDQASERLVSRAAPAAARLFDDEGNPTDVTQQAISFCLAAHHEQTRTLAFASAVGQAGILVERHIRISHGTNTLHTVAGFRVVDESLYRALPEKISSNWLRMGWLDAIALHLASQQSWNTLAELNEAAKPPAARAEGSARR